MILQVPQKHPVTPNLRFGIWRWTYYITMVRRSSKYPPPTQDKIALSRWPLTRLYIEGAHTALPWIKGVVGVPQLTYPYYI